MSRHTEQGARVGALMSDLVAGFFALMVEREKGELLSQRKRELAAILNALLHLLSNWDDP